MKNTFLQLVLCLLFTSAINAQTLKNCSICTTKVIKEEQLKGLSLDEIRLLTNEIFARNGYQFENSRFQEFFESKTWYKSKKDNKKVIFNEIEEQNIKILQEVSKKIKLQREDITIQLKKFKELILTDKKSELKLQYNFDYGKEIGLEDSKFLKEVLVKINLDDINYYKNKGLQSITVDNGYVKILFELAIEDENINIFYSYMAHSKIIEDFNEFTDYHSENEFMYNWQFVYKNGKIKFIRLALAG